MSVRDPRLLSNEEIADRVAEGQDGLWPELAERVVRIAYPIVRRGVPGADCDDEVQNVLIRFWKALPSYEPPRPLFPWVAVIARRELIDYYRVRSREVDLEPIDWLGDAVSDTAPSALTTADLVEWMTRLVGQVDAEAICWRAFEGYTYAEIGSKLGKTEAAAKMQVRRALQALREVLA